MPNSLDLGVYLVTDRALSLGRGIIDVALAAVAGGAGVVQLREKNISTRAFVELARALAQALAHTGAALVVNDRLDVALACGARGVHLGQDDLDPATARRVLGPQAVIGLSVSSVAEALAARDQPVDYLGAGPVFPTATKADAKAPLGLDGLAGVVAAANRPVVGIGGIDAASAAAVVAAGACGVAVVSAVCSAADPCLAAGQLRRAVAEALGARGGADG